MRNFAKTKLLAPLRLTLASKWISPQTLDLSETNYKKIFIEYPTRNNFYWKNLSICLIVFEINVKNHKGATNDTNDKYIIPFSLILNRTVDFSKKMLKSFFTVHIVRNSFCLKDFLVRASVFKKFGKNQDVVTFTVNVKF